MGEIILNQEANDGFPKSTREAMSSFCGETNFWEEGACQKEPQKEAGE